MSLKAKIEAVIYASEEPVTLAQLAGLLGQEAQAELDHLDAAQHRLALEEAGDSEPLELESSEQAVAQPTDEEQAQEEDAEARGEEFERHLHEAVEAEAAHIKAAREHEAADTAAMSSAEDLEPAEEDETEPVESAEAVPSDEETPVEVSAGAEDKQPEGEESVKAATEPAVADAGTVDEKQLAREVREKERRLRDYFRSLLNELIREYATSDRGLEIREVAGGFRLATKPEYHDAVRGFVKSLKPPMKLSLQALETLAVVAYKQPVTAPEVSEIRGVDSGGVLGSLITRKLVATAGRKQVIGRPILYKTTREFLIRFGLKDLAELPSIEEFEKLAGELAEQEEIPMQHHAPETPEQVEQEKDNAEPQADGDSNDLNETVADETIVDGRISGPPPNDETESDTEGEDSPALDAELQSGKSSG